MFYIIVSEDESSYVSVCNGFSTVYQCENVGRAELPAVFAYSREALAWMSKYFQRGYKVVPYNLKSESFATATLIAA